MRYPLVVLIGLFWSGLFGQDTINQTDARGFKQGHWIYYGKDRPESGIAPEGKVEEGRYIDGMKEGVWVKYQPDGKTPKIKAEYHLNRPVGSYSKGSNPQLLPTETMVNDTLIRYFPNGNIEYKAFYNSNGKEDGKVTYFHSNGQLELSFHAINGIPVGTSYRFNSAGDLLEVIEYGSNGQVMQSEKYCGFSEPQMSFGKYPPTIVIPINTRTEKWQLNGYNKVYNGDDEIWQDGIFKEGQLWDGKVYVYDRDGILLHVEIYKGGVYHSDGQL